MDKLLILASYQKMAMTNTWTNYLYKLSLTPYTRSLAHTLAVDLEEVPRGPILHVLPGLLDPLSC